MKSRYPFLIVVFLLTFVVFFFWRTPKYIDFSEIPQFWDNNRYFVPIKITQFSMGNAPQIEIQIEDIKVSCKVDLGSDGGIVLPLGVIERLRSKSFLYKRDFFGARGKSYQSDVYEIPNIRIGKLKIFPMRAEEKNDESVKDGILQQGKEGVNEDDLGKIGWRVFKPFNLFLDCDHFAMVACDSLNTLKEQGYPVENFILGWNLLKIT